LIFGFVSQNQQIIFSVRLESVSKQPKDPKQKDQFKKKRIKHGVGGGGKNLVPE
jgi:hypothetical protein